MTYVRAHHDGNHTPLCTGIVLLFRYQTIGNMKKTTTAILAAGFLVLIVSVAMLFTVIYIFPSLMNEYYNPVFRSSSFGTDWLFYVHPFVLSWALSWFWDRFKGLFSGSVVVRAFEVAMVYGVVAMVPVLWLTFSAIDISGYMVMTWVAYGIAQAFVAGLVFAKVNP